MRERLARAVQMTTIHAAHWVRRVRRHPRPVRWALGGAFIAGGLVGFLPVLGVWMLPVGLVVLSDDIPWLRRQRRTAHAWLLRRVLRPRRAV